ncbi:DUF5133 domain-containing protein [Streptantibioticus cattleyicolor]|uniref:DUF5133 domain-containing protein n=1 Tax=Streptantibioticus cattleyicolor TaxID=29303 RepID=UPI000213DBAC|nr:DUF5133 domain-containing protein [Streptantibioticus cattleyicolor]CCB71602.1 conserved protein of unknown function [Streptantibioticus cattleyicolor NRRL 8057 = DSM 46488]
MLKPHPVVLRKLLDRYESLEARARSGERVSPQLRRELEDTAYTLCVSTATTEPGAAKAVARRLLADPPAGAARPVTPPAAA